MAEIKRLSNSFSQSILVRNFEPHLGSLLISGDNTIQNLQRYFKADVSQFFLVHDFSGL